MCDGNLLDSFEWFCSGSYIVDGVKNVSAVIPGTARIADADHNVFKDDESFLMLKGLACHLLGTHGAIAVFAAITVDGVVIGLC